MASIEITEIIKTLQTERAQTQDELAKLDKVISALRELSLTNVTANTNRKRRTLSAAGRRKIAKAQKARWAKVKQQRANKG
jgi:ribosomal protein L12E/L44/L45/RPP1/RPP2